MQAAPHLAEGDLLGDVAVAVARELGALAAVRVLCLQPALPLALAAGVRTESCMSRTVEDTQNACCTLCASSAKQESLAIGRFLKAFK